MLLAILVMGDLLGKPYWRCDVSVSAEREYFRSLRGRRVFRLLGVFWRRRLPARMFEQRDRVLNRNSEIRGLVLGEDGEIDANDFACGSKDRRARAAFGRARVICNPPDIKVGDITLSGERLNASRLSQIA